ncbi:MAG: hypothetical protein K2N50_06275 [Clostridia bacterium]|nr:hypothetical protein [Clostridia bacterium]MDE7257540.1 hypothetical protein [Clostridia bacterium]
MNMKRLTVAIFCVILILPAALIKPVYAAAPAYARAIDEKAYFCRERDEKTSLFAVPYTYCIEILRDDGEWYFARYADDAGIYAALEGYCKKQHFEPEYETPETTYLYKTVTVKFSAGGNNSSLPVLNEIALEAAYYGSYEKGGVFYSYVRCQGDFGYIEGKIDDYELNIPTPPPDGDNTGGGSGGNNLNFASIAFIVIASIAVVVVLIIYFTTKKPKIDG